MNYKAVEKIDLSSPPSIILGNLELGVILLGGLAIEMSDITKSYGNVHALTKVKFAAAQGEVHGLVGENGAGKSTFIKILSGIVVPDDGEFKLFGELVNISSPQNSQRMGIQTVFQELTLIPDLTVADNLFRVRQQASNLMRTSFSRTLKHARDLLSSMGIHHIDPGTMVRELPLPDRQIIEICKAIMTQPKILILDESTSALLKANVDWLFRLVQGLRKSGTTVIFTSHRWDEVKTLTDRITIFRSGEYIGTYLTNEITEEEVNKLITGRELKVLYPELDSYQENSVRLSVKNLESSKLHSISFDLHHGEILGIGGLQGQGQRELFQALFGIHKIKGDISVNQTRVKISNPRSAIKKGIGYIPEDRKSEGLLLAMSIRHNISLPILRKLTRLGFVTRKKENELTSEIASKLAIKAPDLEELVGKLSGGNQQKVVLAKWMLSNSPILLFYDVTRGVDVGTKHDIYNLMVELSKKGYSILFYSTETAELVHMSHRVAIMFEGCIRELLERKDISMERVIGLSIGAEV